MATKFYLHDAANVASGTYPTDEQRGATPDWTFPTATTLRTMDTTIGTAQVARSATSAATTSTQEVFIAFFTSPPLAAGTYGGASVSGVVNYAHAESNLGANFGADVKITAYFWRPSTGQRVSTTNGYYCNSSPLSAEAENSAAGTEQVNRGTHLGANTFTIQDGDVLILELWNTVVQGMSTAYVDSIYYDGTVENDTLRAVVSDHAAFWQISDTFTFLGVSISASAGFTLGTLTISASATHPVTTTLAKTLGAATLLSEVDVAVSASAAFTLGALTISSAVTTLATISGSAAFTLGTATVAATADAFVSASAGFTLGTLTISASATHPVTTSFAKTLGAVTVAAEVDVAVVSSFAKTLGAATLLSEVDVAVSASAAFMLGAATVVATVGAVSTISGSAAFTLGVATVAATADAFVSASAAFTLGTLVLTAAADAFVSASAAFTLGALTLVSEVTVVDGVTAAAEITLGELVLVATGTADQPPTPAPAGDPGSGSGASRVRRRKFIVPEEAYGDWSLEKLYHEPPVEPPPADLSLVNRVVYTPLAIAVLSMPPAPLAYTAPAAIRVKQASRPAVEQDDDDDILVLLAALF